MERPIGFEPMTVWVETRSSSTELRSHQHSSLANGSRQHPDKKFGIRTRPPFPSTTYRTDLGLDRPAEVSNPHSVPDATLHQPLFRPTSTAGRGTGVSHLLFLERATGIEPVSSRWQRGALPIELRLLSSRLFPFGNIMFVFTSCCSFCSRSGSFDLVDAAGFEPAHTG